MDGMEDCKSHVSFCFTVKLEVEPVQVLAH